MNRDCLGDYFSVQGKHYYRCIMNGAIVKRTGAGVCPVCTREINAEECGEATNIKTETTFRIPGVPNIHILPG